MSKIIFFLCLITALPLSAEWHFEERAIMGTSIKASLWHTDSKKARVALDTVFDEMERINQLMSPYIESSELAKVNQFADKNPVTVSIELFNLLEKAQAVSEKTQGAFDITFASVGFLYNYREKVHPDKAALNETKQLIDYKSIALDKSTHTVMFLKPNMKIDLGGIAKGYAVDNAIEKLKKLGISSALVSAGGDTKALGSHQNRPWFVAVQDPRKKGRHALQLPLEDEAISTSGDYERYFEKDGVRYHHILDPATGSSSKQVQSVSIIGKDATMTDALSTSVFVLGTKDGLALINRLPNYEALIIDSERKLHFSQGLMAQ